MYKIGEFKNGSHFAKESFASESLNEVKERFVEMWNATEFCPEGSDNEAADAEEAWYYKRFSVDTNNIGVFEVEDDEPMVTNYVYAGGVSNLI